MKAHISVVDANHTHGKELCKIEQSARWADSIFRNPKNSDDFPFEVSEVSPEVKPRARKKAPATETTTDKTITKETKKETT